MWNVKGMYEVNFHDEFSVAVAIVVQSLEYYSQPIRRLVGVVECAIRPRGQSITVFINSAIKSILL